MPARIALATAALSEGRLSIRIAQFERRGDLKHDVVWARKDFEYQLHLRDKRQIHWDGLERVTER